MSQEQKKEKDDQARMDTTGGAIDSRTAADILPIRDAVTAAINYVFSQLDAAVTAQPCLYRNAKVIARWKTGELIEDARERLLQKADSAIINAALKP